MKERHAAQVAQDAKGALVRPGDKVSVPQSYKQRQIHSAYVLHVLTDGGVLFLRDPMRLNKEALMVVKANTCVLADERTYFERKHEKKDALALKDVASGLQALALPGTNAAGATGASAMALADMSAAREAGQVGGQMRLHRKLVGTDVYEGQPKHMNEEYEDEGDLIRLYKTHRCLNKVNRYDHNAVETEATHVGVRMRIVGGVYKGQLCNFRQYLNHKELKVALSIKPKIITVK